MKPTNKLAQVLTQAYEWRVVTSRIAILALLSAAGLTTAAAAQQDSAANAGNGPPPAPGHYAFFLDRSSIEYPIVEQTIHAPAYYKQFRGNDFDDVAFEAYIAPAFFIHNGVTTADVEGGTGGGWSKVWTFLPITRFRQLDSYSDPLRSASFMPRFVSLQLLKIQRQYDSASHAPRWPGGLRIWGLQFLLQHHSNGGPGCLFVEDSVIRNQCTARIPPDQRTLDTAGSFSTDFAQIGFSHLNGLVDSVGLLLHSLTVGADIEMHSSWLIFLPGTIGREQASVYGPYRVKANVEYQHVLGSWLKFLVAADAEYIVYEHKPSPNASPIAFEAESDLSFDDGDHFWRGLGLELRYYQGQDYYNLFFVRDIRRVFFGIVIDPSSQHLRP